jgi:hypothetical protein
MAFLQVPGAVPAGQQAYRGSEDRADPAVPRHRHVIYEHCRARPAHRPDTRAGGAPISRSQPSSRTLREALQAARPALPGPPAALDPLARLTKRHGRAQPALAHPAHLLGLHQAGQHQDPDVLLDPVQGQARRPASWLSVAGPRPSRSTMPRHCGSQSAKNVAPSMSDRAPIGSLHLPGQGWSVLALDRQREGGPPRCRAESSHHCGLSITGINAARTGGDWSPRRGRLRCR